MSAGIAASTTMQPSAVWRLTFKVVPLTSTFLANVSWGTPSSSARIGGTMPVLPSYDSVAQITRSGDSALIAAASALPVSSASAPASFSSVMRMPRSDPMDRPLRIASLARSGPIDTSTTSPPCASLSCSPSSIPHSSPGSTTASLSRASVLSDSRAWVELGSGTCLTVTTIFTTKPPFGGRGCSIIARSDRRPEPQVVVRGVETADDIAFDVLQPGHLHAREHLGGAPVATVQRRADDRQRGLPVRRTNWLGPAVDSGNGCVTRAGGRDRDVRDIGCDIGHVAGHHEDRIEARGEQSGLDAGERAARALAVEDHAIRDRLFQLLGLGERDHHLRKRGGEPVHHPAEQDRVPHLEPRLRPGHPPALAAGEHEQRGFHGDYHRPCS